MVSAFACFYCHMPTVFVVCRWYVVRLHATLVVMRMAVVVMTVVVVVELEPADVNMLMTLVGVEFVEWQN